MVGDPYLSNLVHATWYGAEPTVNSEAMGFYNAMFHIEIRLMPWYKLPRPCSHTSIAHRSSPFYAYVSVETERFPIDFPVPLLLSHTL